MVKDFFRKKMYFLWKFLKINFSNKQEYKLKNIICDKSKKIYIFLAADYPNYGDIAITYAQKLYLSDNFKDYTLVEIPCNKTLDYIKIIKNNLKENDIVTIVGGGNIGDKYYYYEELRLTVMKMLRRHAIISFPQTVDFSKTKKGQKKFKKSLKIYKKCKNLVFFAREENTFNLMKDKLKKDVYLSPDIVLYLKNKLAYTVHKKDHDGYCFRKDKEVEPSNIEKISQVLNEKKPNDIAFDTVDEKNFDYYKRYNLMLNKINQIANCKKIYTNRLHAMIFAYLCNVECEFFDNSNKKISGVYNCWLHNVKIIKNHDITSKKISRKVINLAAEFNNMKKIIERRI